MLKRCYNWLSKNEIYVKLLLSTLVFAVLAILCLCIDCKDGYDFFMSLFSGMLTGWILVAFNVSKNRKKRSVIKYKSMYEYFWDIYLNIFKDDKLNVDNSVNVLLDVVSDLRNCCKVIERYEDYYFKSDDIKKIFKEELNFDVNKKNNKIDLIIEKMNDFENNRDYILKAIEELKIDILMMNIKIRGKIVECEEEIYRIDGMFI